MNKLIGTTIAYLILAVSVLFLAARGAVSEELRLAACPRCGSSLVASHRTKAGWWQCYHLDVKGGTLAACGWAGPDYPERKERE